MCNKWKYEVLLIILMCEIMCNINIINNININVYNINININNNNNNNV